MSAKTHKGVRIYECTFKECFAPILTDLNKLHIYSGDFHWPEPPEDWESEKEEWNEHIMGELKKFCVDDDPDLEIEFYFKPDFLSFIDYRMEDDWNELWCFSDPIPSREKIEQLQKIEDPKCHLDYLWFQQNQP